MNALTASTMLGAALDYVARAVATVPLHTPSEAGCSCSRGPACESPGKHPRVPWGDFQGRRATVAEVRTWWDRWPDANVGIITGMVSGIAVLDVDGRNGGFETLADLDAYGGAMPEDNPVVETGSRGLHHYFALSAPLPKAAPFQGIEVQGDGALVVAPPSLHHSGRRYRWLRGLASPWPTLPQWVRWAATQVTTPRRDGAAASIPDATADGVLHVLQERGLYLGRHRRAGLHRIRCPWAAEHSNADVEAIVLEPGVSPAAGWGFRCLHAHCATRHIGELLDLLQIARRAA